MTLIYPESGDDSSDMILSEAQQIFQRTVKALNGIVIDLEDNKTGAAAETSSLLKELKAILIPAVSERERLEKRRKHEAGVVNDYAVDFDAARLEIGRRLACLRAAGDQGRIPE